MASSDVIVIGGGLHGLSSALQLARRGCKVLVLEAQSCGQHASGVNAGGVRTLGRDLAEVPLALASQEIWHHLSELVDDDAGFVPSGHLKVAENAAELAILNERVRLLHSCGFTHEELVDARQVRQLVPCIAAHIAGGIWVRRDGHALPYRAVTAFRLAALRAGVAIHQNTPVQRIGYQGGQWTITSGAKHFNAGYVVNAAGAWAGALAAQAGDAVPVQAGGLMLMITHRAPPFVIPVLGATGRALSLKQFANGTVLIGGGLRCTADLSARYAEVDMPRLAGSARTVVDLFPHLKHLGIIRAWAGVEAFMPDGIPIIGLSTRAPNLVHNFGFSAHGFELGPICGQIVAELITEGRSSQPIEPFSVDRFTRHCSLGPRPSRGKGLPN